VRDLAFYNVGCQEPRGARRLVVPARRAMRRLLRPIFQRQVEIFQSLCDRIDAAEVAEGHLRSDLDDLARRQDELADQVQHAIAFGWDYVAMVRRLALLEDRVSSLAAAGSPAPESRPAPTSPE
jgi:hypothetical protein